MSWQKYQGYYVYTYLDENSKPYYVGMGTKNRVIAKHIYVTVPKFDRIVVEDGLTQQAAWDKEIELIALYGREHLGTGPLKNLTPGGPTQKSGWAQSKLAKEKISLGNRGNVRSEEHKKNYRKPKTTEHAAKISAANIGRADDGRYEKIGKTMSLKRWYNNGQVSKMFEPGQEISGFYPGRKLKENAHVVA
jgi:hypothetical protein